MKMITIENNFLCLRVSTLGAEMMSLCSASGREYLWQGDPAYWEGRAPLLFPFIARLTNNSYTLHGKTYPMSIHGFASAMEFIPVKNTGEELVLELTDNAETRRQYPFAFCLRVTFRLNENSLEIGYRVENRSTQTMPFAIGGHPGFRVGGEAGDCFEDYTLEFSQSCQPDRVGFTENVFLSGEDRPYPLEDGNKLPLRHGLFDDDAIILKNMDRKVTLKSAAHRRTLTVSFPDFPYLGFWHWPKTDAPYICIEPWTSLPSRQDVVEEFTCKSDMIQLHAGNTFETTWSIAISE